jgi:ABC-type transport system substrate-binding protein/PKD repeat protein
MDMETSYGRATRTTLFGGVLFAVLLVGVPSFFMPGLDAPLEFGGIASAGVDRERDFVVGVVDLSTGVSTFNPNTFTMSSESMFIFPCYSTLLQYNSDATKIVGDLAYDWEVSPDGLTWTFWLVDNAYFCDRSDPYRMEEDNLVTAEDVAFTCWAIQNNSGSRMHPNFPDVIDSITSNGDFEVTIHLGKPFSVVMESWLGTPILPKYIWEDEDFLKFENNPPIGSGAFYYNTDGLPTEGTAILERNPVWYGTENHGWQMRCDRWILLNELSDDTAWMDVKSGKIDVALGVSPTIYTTQLLYGHTDDVTGRTQCNGFVFEFNLNQMNDTLRAEVGGALTAGRNNQLLLDEDIKLAMSMCIDKYGFIEEVLKGLGSYADSLIPPQNPGHYWYPDPDPFDIPGARAILHDAGWKYDLTGNELSIDSEYAPRCKAGGTDPLRFDFITLDTDNQWKLGANVIIDWTKKAGFDLYTNLEYLNVNDMNSAWYQADYDVWLWDWVMPVLSEPVTILEVFITDAIGTDQDVYWSNETFDALYEEALVTMDPVARTEITDQMQAMAYEMRGCQCIAYRDELYAVNTVEWAPESLGDWNSSYLLLPDVWPWYVGAMMYPNENNAPHFTMPPDDKDDVIINTPYDFVVAGGDDDILTTLEYRWFWGDGSRSSWSTDPTATHTYSKDGVYYADVAVREATSSKGFDDFFITSAPFEVTVKDPNNRAPVKGSDFTWSPAAPDSGSFITFEAFFSDPDGDELYHTWDFGDGHTLSGQSVEYQYGQEGTFSVTVSVTDNHIGTDSRPVTETHMLYVSQNHIPTISVPDFANIKTKTPTEFTITASDVDPGDSLKFTWIWGDGETTVTTDTTATHSYNSRGSFTLTVWADDGTGLPGHNKSDTGLVYVIASGGNKAPVILSFSADITNPYAGQEVTFTSSARDGDGDALTFTIEFGDGTYAVGSFGPTADNQAVEFVAANAYDATLPYYSAYLHVSDGLANISSEEIPITVVPNEAPVFTAPPEDEYIDTGVSTTFTVEVLDADDDPLRFTWIWGDGTRTVTTVETAQHTYTAAGDYAYWVWVDDLCGHNVSDAAMAYVNTIPYVTPLSDRSVEVGELRTYTVTASDDEDDDLTITWDFGDGTVVCTGSTPSVQHTYDAVNDYQLTVYVDDGFPKLSHNVSSEATITVLEAGVNYPPNIQPLSDMTETVDELLTFVAFVDDPNDDPLTISWDFGDTTWGSGTSVQHAYSSVDVYTVTVYAYDGEYNVSESATVTILGDASPVAVANVPSSADEDTSVTFSGASSSDDVGIASYEWTIVELPAVLLTGVSVQHTFWEPDEYTVELTVTDTIGQTDTDTTTITIADVTPPEAVATASPDSTVNMGDTVTLDASTSSDNSGTIASYVWGFFDGVDDVGETGMTITHDFLLPGEYSIRLTVTDEAGNEGVDDTLVVTVLDTENPVADAGADATIDAGTLHTFDGSGSTDNTEVIASYTWTFDDDGPQVLDGVSPSYTFDNVGVFTVTLTVEDEAANSATDTVVITVLTASANEPPVADAGPDQTVTVGDEVTFDGSGSSDSDGTIANYTWTFTYDGVAEELYDESPTFDFDIVGTYTVTLNVTDDDGATDTDTMTVTVQAAVPTNEPPVADAGDDQTVTVGKEVTFVGSGSTDSDGTIANYTWTFTYDGTPVTLYGVSPKFTFEVAGTYTVTLTVTDDDGDTDTDTVKVTVEEDDKKSFLESYGLPLGLAIALIVAALVAFFVLKGRKGGKAEGAVELEGISAGEPEVPPPDQS